MRGIDLLQNDLLSLADKLRRREISPVELTRACLERAHALNPKINAFITILDDLALAQAKEAEAEIVAGSYKGPLHGIPYAAKDLLATKGQKTTCGSTILDGNISDFDAAVVERLRRAGAILLGKANMHEFAFGLTNHNPHYGHARNPWDTERITGGSSGGSGAAVAASVVPLALGTDTGGSIRIPASLCGITGLKPTYGRVSKFGAHPLSWTLDHVGPMTKTAADAAAALEVLAGYDQRDPSSADRPTEDYSKYLEGGLEGLTIGLLEPLYFEKIHPKVDSLVRAAAGELGELGARVIPIEIPDLDNAAKATLLILSSEAATALEVYHRNRGQDLGADVRSRLDVGATHLATHYLDAMRWRRRMHNHFARAFEKVDLLLTPGVSIPAARIEDSTVTLDGDTVPVGIALTRCTRIYNLMGLPSVCVPCGLSDEGLPVALQLAGKPFAEALVLKAAHAYQRNCFSVGEWPRP